MDPRVSGLLEKMKNRRVTSTLLVVLTLALGILIGSVISIGVKGKEGQKSGETATPLTVPPPQQLSSAFAALFYPTLPFFSGRRGRNQLGDVS